MLLTNITNAVITSTQTILSNVNVELRVVSASSMKFAQKAMHWLSSKPHHDSPPQLSCCWLWLGGRQLLARHERNQSAC